ncbi:MAG: glycoside hydrolase family 2 protein [Bacilli bacterium]
MRREYPRKELERKSFISLNGEWDFAFDFAQEFLSYYPHFNHTTKPTLEFSPVFDRKINVPFVPECELSGIGHRGFINACWYRRKIKVKFNENERVIINFEAVFHTSHLYVNHHLVGSHRGGYTPFSFDITDFLDENGVGEIVLHVLCDARDETMPSGKQSHTLKPLGCFYERCSGIWAPVWLEIVPITYLKSIYYKSDVPNKTINLILEIENPSEGFVAVDVYFNQRKVGSSKMKLLDQKEMIVPVSLSEIILWNPGEGNLYQVQINLSDVDDVSSYFGLRELVLDQYGLIINGKRVYQRLVLDQGYYPKGMYTAEDETDFIKQIQIALDMGFNGARLHQKLFDRTFLYHADRMGYMVWGEYPSWGFDYASDRAYAIFAPEWKEAILRDRNHPAIIGWCPMNENWALFGKRQNDRFVRDMYLLTKFLDPTRPCIDVSWNYHVMTDIYDVHDYAQGETFAEHQRQFEEGKIWDSFWKEQKPYEGEPYFVSEYGGLKWPDSLDGWGYNGPNKITSEEDFVNRFQAFHDVMYQNPRICASCYTQLYDVQQECNGLYYYNKETKFSKETIKKIKAIVSQKTAYEKIPLALGGK